MKAQTNIEGRPLYRRGEKYAREMAGYILDVLDEGRDFLLSPTRRAIVQAIRKKLTEREKECIALYYERQLNLNQIGAQLGICQSTASRNVERGEAKINRILDFARALLGEVKVS